MDSNLAMIQTMLNVEMVVDVIMQMWTVEIKDMDKESDNNFVSNFLLYVVIAFNYFDFNN